MAEKILKTEYSEEMQRSYMNYSMSVITARAIPDARDGLKPVQRRVLYDMSELRLNHDKPHRKSARIVGDTMGKYHPHGDSSIYETLVVLSQEFKKGMTLVDGHGNFGSIEGDGAAAMRYTEARLEKFAEEVYLKDLDKTVNFVPNYDETEKEPEVLPVRVPNLLINGAEGIAVGMSTSIPPHNLGEVVDAVDAYIDDPDISTQKLMELMPGPDFPTGGIIANKSDLPAIYETGSGKIKLRGKMEVELGKRKADKDKLVITEIPYTMIGAGINKFLMDVADLVESKKLTDVVDISNQSNKEGIRIVLELRKDADIEKIRNILYKKTKLEDTFGVNMLAIAGGRPETLSLRGILKNFLDFQYQNTEKKYQVLLQKERERQEVQEGLIAACDCIDLIIAVLRGSKNLKDARACLTTGDISNIKFKTPGFEADAKKLHFTERQASAILEMRLYKLIGLEILALEKEHKETLRKIARLRKDPWQPRHHEPGDQGRSGSHQKGVRPAQENPDRGRAGGGLRRDRGAGAGGGLRHGPVRLLQAVGQGYLRAQPGDGGHGAGSRGALPEYGQDSAVHGYGQPASAEGDGRAGRKAAGQGHAHRQSEQV